MPANVDDDSLSGCNALAARYNTHQNIAIDIGSAELPTHDIRRVVRQQHSRPDIFCPYALIA